MKCNGDKYYSTCWNLWLVNWTIAFFRRGHISGRWCSRGKTGVQCSWDTNNGDKWIWTKDYLWAFMEWSWKDSMFRNDHINADSMVELWSFGEKGGKWSWRRSLAGGGALDYLRRCSFVPYEMDVVLYEIFMYADINLALTWSPRDALSSQEGRLILWALMTIFKN